MGNFHHLHGKVLVSDLWHEVEKLLVWCLCLEACCLSSAFEMCFSMSFSFEVCSRFVLLKAKLPTSNLTLEEVGLAWTEVARM